MTILKNPSLIHSSLSLFLTVLVFEKHFFFLIMMMRVQLNDDEDDDHHDDDVGDQRNTNNCRSKTLIKS